MKELLNLYNFNEILLIKKLGPLTYFYRGIFIITINENKLLLDSKSNDRWKNVYIL